jgi:acetyl-CoA synthetase
MICFKQWFKGATTNICYNAVDRHISAGNGDKVAIYWEGNEPGQDGQLTYSQLLDRVCQVCAHHIRLIYLNFFLKNAYPTSNLFYGSVEFFLQLANYLKEVGVRKGDAVIIYLPMLMELPIAMLACARIGAVHSVCTSLSF